VVNFVVYFYTADAVAGIQTFPANCWHPMWPR